MPIVYVQRKGNDWMSRNCYDAASGFTTRGYEVRGFVFDDLGSLPLTKETIVYGGIASVKKALTMIGVSHPPDINIPDPLLPFAKRKVWETTLGEIRKSNFEQSPVFIKPRSAQKLFTGFVLKNFRDLEKTFGFPDDLELLASEVMNFLSEWRFYVLNREIIGVGHYHGDCRVFPEATVAHDIIDAWSDQPVAYSVDLAWNFSYQTVLIEVNDAYALGNYGIPSPLYAKMVEARWAEMVGMKKEWLIF